MMKRKLIRVTEHDIYRGVVRSSAVCPVALALRRRAGVGYEVRYNGIYRGAMNLRQHISAKVKEFISQFDTGRPVKPFNFYIKVPA